MTAIVKTKLNSTNHGSHHNQHHPNHQQQNRPNQQQHPQIDHNQQPVVAHNHHQHYNHHHHHHNHQSNTNNGGGQQQQIMMEKNWRMKGSSSGSFDNHPNNNNNSSHCYNKNNHHPSNNNNNNNNNYSNYNNNSYNGGTSGSSCDSVPDTNTTNNMMMPPVPNPVPTDLINPHNNLQQQQQQQNGLIVYHDGTGNNANNNVVNNPTPVVGNYNNNNNSISNNNNNSGQHYWLREGLYPETIFQWNHRSFNIKSGKENGSNNDSTAATAVAGGGGIMMSKSNENRSLQISNGLAVSAVENQTTTTTTTKQQQPPHQQNSNNNQDKTTTNGSSTIADGCPGVDCNNNDNNNILSSNGTQQKSSVSKNQIISKSSAGSIVGNKGMDKSQTLINPGGNPPTSSINPPRRPPVGDNRFFPEFHHRNPLNSGNGNLSCGSLSSQLKGGGNPSNIETTMTTATATTTYTPPAAIIDDGMKEPTAAEKKEEVVPKPPVKNYAEIVASGIGNNNSNKDGRSSDHHGHGSKEKQGKKDEKTKSSQEGKLHPIIAVTTEVGAGATGKEKLKSDLPKPKPRPKIRCPVMFDSSAVEKEKPIPNTLDDIIQEKRGRRDSPSDELQKKNQPEKLVDITELSSYNWDNDNWTPTIIVPGRARIFKEWKGGVLDTKNEQMIKDEESYRNPLHPMDSLITAVLAYYPTFNFGEIDIVMDLAALKRLAKFIFYACGNGTHWMSKEQMEREIFRLDIGRIGQGTTDPGPLIICRHESSNTSQWMGYGADFMRSCTSHDPSTDMEGINNGPYKRISLLTLGRLRILLRYKITALKKKSGSSRSNTFNNNNNGPSLQQQPNDSNNHQWNSSNSNNNNKTRCNRMKCGVGWDRGIVGLGRREVTNQSVYDGRGDGCDGIQWDEFGEPVILASLGHKHSRLSVEKWLDMVFTQTNELYLGRHEQGVFDEMSWLNRDQVKQMTGNWSDRSFINALEELLSGLIHWSNSVGDCSVSMGPWDQRPSLTLRRSLIAFHRSLCPPISYNLQQKVLQLSTGIHG